MKKLVSIMLALCLMICCAVALADSTYEKAYTAEEINGNVFHNGFVTAVGGVEVNTLTLKDDGSYEYVKHIFGADESGAKAEDGIDLIYTFIGTYTQDGDTVVLAFPTDGSFSEDWALLAEGGDNVYFLNSSGTLADTVQCKEDESHNPADLFPGEFLVDSLASSQEGFDPANCTVTVTLNGDSFDYVIVNSDDE